MYGSARFCGERVTVPIRVGAARQHGTVRLERQGGSAFRLHLRRLEDRPASGVAIFVLIRQPLREVRGHQVILAV